MKVVPRVLAALGLLAFLYALWLFQFWFRTPAGPHLTSINGLWQVENCSAPSTAEWPTCIQLACEGEAKNRRVLPNADRSIVSYMHWRTNTPDASIVAVKQEIDKEVRVAQCNLERLQVVAVKTITAKEFHEAGIQ